MRVVVFIFILSIGSFAQARTCSDFWSGSYPYRAYVEDMQAVDAALPCSNVLSEQFGELTVGSMNSIFDAGIYNVLARRNESEMSCRVGYYDRMIASDRDRRTSAAIDRFVQLRRDFAAARADLRAEEARANQIVRNAGGDAIDRRSGILGNSVITSGRIERARRNILSGVPFGIEPDVQRALLALDRELPEDFYNNPALVARFDEEYDRALHATRDRYYNGWNYIHQKFQTNYVTNPSTGTRIPSGGYYAYDRDTRNAFLQSGQVEDLAAELQDPQRTRRPISREVGDRMICSLDPNGDESAETMVTTTIGVGALATGPAAPVIEGGIALYYTGKAIRECFITPDIDVVRGQTCVESGTLEGAIQTANANRCSAAVVPAVMSAAGVAATFAATWRIVRNAEGRIVALRPAGSVVDDAERALARGAAAAEEPAEVSAIVVRPNFTSGQWRERARGLISRLNGNRAEALRAAGYTAESGAPRGFQKYCSETRFCITLPEGNQPLNGRIARDFEDAYAARANGRTEWVHPDARRAAARGDAPPAARVADQPNGAGGAGNRGRNTETGGSPNAASASAPRPGSVEAQVQDVTGSIHTDWRATYRAANGDAPRFKPVPLNEGEAAEQGLARLRNQYPGLEIQEGALVQNINQPAEAIVPSLNARLNGNLARDYVALARDGRRFVRATDFEEASDGIHQIWMRANEWQRASNPQLFVPFRQLSAAEKLKDLDVLAMTLRTTNPSALESAGFRAYRARLLADVEREAAAARVAARGPDAAVPRVEAPAAGARPRATGESAEGGVSAAGQPIRTTAVPNPETAASRWATEIRLANEPAGELVPLIRQLEREGANPDEIRRALTQCTGR